MRILVSIIVLCCVFMASTGAFADVARVTAEGKIQPVYFEKVKIDGFWKKQFKRLTENWIPHCVRQMEEGGEGQELLNLVHTANVLKGEPHGEYTGTPWSDAYVYNTVETICLALAVDPEDDVDLARAQQFLQQKMEQWIPVILAAQCDDGYIHSFHIVNKHPRYSRITWHEFYVQGYFIEMGVAHYRVTGGKDRRLYEAAIRCADRLCNNFGPSPKRLWIHGHAGMGYSLCRLARLVNEADGSGKGDKYFELAKFLLDNRHTVEEHRHPYHQSHRPVVEMTDAVGHAVRATYFYTAMADLAMLTGDAGYLAAVDRIWDNAIDRKHYITGGVGASHQGEAFAEDFDLRNDGYCESCAGCGMTFWADRMHRIHGDGHHVDVQERTLYNNILGAVELSGKNFFYQNPLVSAKARYSWHGCPCCVGNIPRSLLAIKDLMYSLESDQQTLYVSHFVGSEVTFPDVAGASLKLRQQTGYPWSGDIKLELTPDKPTEFTLKLRIPNRTESPLYKATPDLSRQYTVSVNGQSQSPSVRDGYISLHRTWTKGDVVELALPMEVQRIHCDDRVVANRGRVALIRGPMAYNVEDVDHGFPVNDLVLPVETPLEAEWKSDLLDGVMVIEGQCSVGTEQGLRPTRLLAIPNFVRLNRGGASQVWIMENPDKVEVTHSSDGHVVKPIVREELDRRTIDRVVIGDIESEKQHRLSGQRTGAGVFRNLRWRHAGNGWFSYELEVKPDVQNYLFCTYWGSDSGNRRFAILVNGQEIARQVLDNNEPNEFFDVEYTIPRESTQAGGKVTVRFSADERATAGGIFDLRTVTQREGN